jgi:hypothetical protein
MNDAFATVATIYGVRSTEYILNHLDANLLVQIFNSTGKRGGFRLSLSFWEAGIIVGGV